MESTIRLRIRMDEHPDNSVCYVKNIIATDFTDEHGWGFAIYDL